MSSARMSRLRSTARAKGAPPSLPFWFGEAPARTRELADEVGAVREGALLAPQQAIVRNSKGEPTAMVVGKDDRIEVRAVKVSHAIGDKWLVEDGLAAGERVVVEGFQKIRPGVTVQAVEAGAQPPAAPAPPQQ